tara:strand:+ start:586 stop:942 length:357 start_codon:yes stop_codon:yes gene_type:complete
MFNFLHYHLLFFKNLFLTLLFFKNFFVPKNLFLTKSIPVSDNRLADLQYRTQFALTKIVSNQWNSTLNPYNSLLFSHDITAKTHPFEKPQCDGVGCAMKYIIPQIIVWIYVGFNFVFF